MENNYLIINGTILTLENKHDLLHQDILVEDGIITNIGDYKQFVLPDAYRVIDAKDKLVCPSFYNMHVHLGETIFRGRCDGMNLWEYLDVSHDSYDNPVWYHNEAEIHRLSGLITIMESIKHGVGYIACNRGWEEVKNTKIEASCLFPVVNIGKLKSYYDNIPLLKQMKQDYDVTGMETSIFLQSMYLCDEERLQLIKQMMTEDPNIKLFVHISETEKELDYVKDKYLCTPIQALDSFELLTERTFLVHAIYLTEDDIQLIKRKNANIVLCPISNLKLGDGYPLVEQLIQAKIPLIAATDGFATNNSASLLEELKVLAIMSNGKIPCDTLLHMITCNPAQRVSGDSRRGIIAKGSKTNISIFSTEKYNLIDYPTLISNMVYNHTEFQCDYVISNGRLIYDNREIVTVDKNSIVAEYYELLNHLFFEKDWKGYNEE